MPSIVKVRSPSRNFDQTYTRMKYTSNPPQLTNPPTTPVGTANNHEKHHQRRDGDLGRSSAVNYQPVPGSDLASYMPPQQSSKRSPSQHCTTRNNKENASFERDFGPFGTVPQQNVKSDVADLLPMYRRSDYQPIPCLMHQQEPALPRQQPTPRPVNLTDGVNMSLRSKLPCTSQAPVLSGAASLTNSQRSLRRNEDVDRILNKYGRSSRSSFRDMDNNKDPDFSKLGQDVYVTTPDKYCKKVKGHNQEYWTDERGQAHELIIPQRRRNVEDACSDNTSQGPVPDDVGGHSGRRPVDEATNKANYLQQQHHQTQQTQFSVLPAFTFKQSSHVFPFKESSDGHLLVESKQIAFESRKLCVLMSDPNNNATIEFSTNQLSNGHEPTNQIGHERILHEVKRAMSLIVETPETYGRSNPNFFGVRKDINSCYSDSKKATEEFEQRMLLRLNCGKNADTHVMIGDKIFPCHSIALEAFSSYFDRLNRPPENIQKIYLPEGEVSPDAFSVLMDWIVQSEEGRKEIPKKKNLVPVYIAAKYLGMKDLESQCISFMEKKVDSSDPDLLTFWDAVKNRQFMCPELVRIIASKMAASYRDIYESKKYLQMDVDELSMLLGSDDISIDSEMDVYNSAVLWLLHDWKARKTHTNRIMSTVRFGLLSPLQLTQISRCPEITQVKGEKDFNQILTYGTVKSMIDDGLSYSILDESYKSQPEELKKWVEKTGMKVPAQRTSLLHKKPRGGPLILEKISLLEDASQTVLRPGAAKPLQQSSSYTLMKEPSSDTPIIDDEFNKRNAFKIKDGSPNGSKSNINARSKSRIPMKSSQGTHKLPPHAVGKEKRSKRHGSFHDRIPAQPGSNTIVHELSKPKLLNASPTGSETDIGDDEDILLSHPSPSDSSPENA